MQLTSSVKRGAGYDFLEDYQKYFRYCLRTFLLNENNLGYNNNKIENIITLSSKQRKLHHRSDKTRRQKPNLHNWQQSAIERNHLHQQQQYYQQKLQLQQDFQLVETLSTMQLQHHLSTQQQELIQQLQLVQQQYFINKGFVKPLHLDYQALMQQEDSTTSAISLHQHQLKQHLQKHNNDKQQQQKHQQLRQQENRKNKSMDKFVDQFRLSPQQQQLQQDKHFEQIQFELKHISNTQYSEHDIKQDNIRPQHEEKTGQAEEDADCRNEDFHFIPGNKHEASKRSISIDDTNINDLQCNSNSKINNNNKNNSVGNDSTCNAEKKPSSTINSNLAAVTDATSISPTREAKELHPAELSQAQEIDVAYSNCDDCPRSSNSNKYKVNECKQRQSQERSTTGHSNKHPALFLPTKPPAIMKIEDDNDEDDDMEEKPAPDVGENMAFLSMQYYTRSSRDSHVPQQQHTNLYHQQDHGLQPTEGLIGPPQPPPPPPMPMTPSTFSAHTHGGACVQDSDGDYIRPSGVQHLESFNAKKNFHPLYAQGVCRWPSCELALDDIPAFIKNF